MPKSVLIALFALVTIFVSNVRAGEILDSICAVVDDDIILESEVGYGVNSVMLEQNIKHPTALQLSMARDQVLQAYVTQKILLALANEDTLTVEDRVVDKELDKKFNQIVQQVGGEDKLVTYFGRPLRQIKREMRKGVKEGLLIDMVKRQHLGAPQIRRQDVLDFFQQHQAEFPTLPERIEISHILLAVEPSEAARSAAHDKIQAVMTMLQGGADFDSVAKKMSDDPSAENGGRLGFTNRGDLVPEYEAAAYAMEPGEISQIVETRYGFHIIKVLERQGERISTQHILAKLSPTADDLQKARDLAAQLRDSLVKGADFAALAKQYSTDNDTKNKGGKLDILPLDNLPAEFKTALTGLNAGDLTQPFESSFGVHLVHIEKRYPARSVTIADDWQTIEQYALNAKREEQFQKWVKTQWEGHYIWPEDLKEKTLSTQ